MSEMIYGIHAVQALLERAPERFQEVFILKGREDKRLMPLIHALEAQGVVIQVANRQYLDEKSEGAVHQGIIAREAGSSVSGKRSAGSDRQPRTALLPDPRWRYRSP
jgi:tRNA G18 (ribose-2'-O)-methylase SpoU